MDKDSLRLLRDQFSSAHDSESYLDCCLVVAEPLPGGDQTRVSHALGGAGARRIEAMRTFQDGDFKARQVLWGDGPRYLIKTYEDLARAAYLSLTDVGSDLFPGFRTEWPNKSDCWTTVLFWLSCEEPMPLLRGSGFAAAHQLLTDAEITSGDFCTGEKFLGHIALAKAGVNYELKDKQELRLSTKGSGFLYSRKLPFNLFQTSAFAIDLLLDSPEMATARGKNIIPFPTPEGARWGDLVITFTNGNTVRATIKGASKVIGFEGLGMMSGKDGEPTKQWQLLRTLARNHGTLSWKQPGADRKNQKRREYLARDLQHYFRIDGDPIEFIGRERNWKTRFRISEKE